MNKEEFLAFSLPYKLKLKGLDGSIAILTNGSGISLGEYSLEWVLRTTLSSPILHPLSDLTKEIEHNGEKFTPIEYLFKVEHPAHDPKGRKCYYENSGRFISCSGVWCSAETSFNIIEISKNNFWKIKKLIEWHFDIAGLIDKNEAIDINTLQENPYK